ncbi:hypothetical protein OCU04_004189 [Sclerotinia nivalis]|uniref:PKS/mFAS DH domain-containing protein n=1 Tax=Sclerotinia nivalis TaxID=352851 RepID=A0A9X0APZ3_9HELO|nr:hypothetical protein OCU04_004189 [Sclerotinia nivalis]
MYESMTRSCLAPLDPKAFYGMLGQNGLGFGPSFHRVTSGSYGSQGQVKGTIKLFEWPEKEHPQAHIIHPTSLDAIFHLAIAGHCEGGAKGIPTMVPTFLQKLFVSKHGLQFSDESDVQECAWTIEEDSLAVHFDGFVLNPSRDKIVVRFENLKLIRIGELLEDAKSSMISQSHHRSYNFEYRPDPWLLSGREIWEYCKEGLHASQTPFDRYIDMLRHKNSNLNILEIGAEGERPTSDILETLSIYNEKEKPCYTRYGSYCFVSDLQSVLNEAKKDLQNYSRLAFEHLDVEADPLRQGSELEAYDIILAPMKFLANKTFVDQTRKMLKPVGQLMFHEPCKVDTDEKHRTSDVKFNSSSKASYVAVGLKLSASKGVVEVQVNSSVTMPSPTSNTRTICIVSDPESSLQIESAKKIENLLRYQGVDNITQATLFEAQDMDRLENIVFVTLLELNNPFIYSLSQENYYIMKNFLISAPSVLWVNSYGGSPTGNPEYAPIQGLARVLRNEYNHHRLTIVSFDCRSWP